MNLGSIQSNATATTTGGGISYDRKSFGIANDCFNVKETRDFKVIEDKSLNTGVSNDVLKNMLRIDADKAIGAGHLSFEPISPYLRQFEDHEYQVSWNWYDRQADNVTVTVGGTGQSSLTRGGL